MLEAELKERRRGRAMDLGLSGTRVLVAGASQGIGQGIAEALLEEERRCSSRGSFSGPLQVAFEAFAAQHGDRVAQHAADMTATDGITGAFAAMEAAFGGVDAVIANVGGGGLKPGWDVSDDDLAYALEQNLTGTIRLAGRQCATCRAGGYKPHGDFLHCWCETPSARPTATASRRRG